MNYKIILIVFIILILLLIIAYLMIVNKSIQYDSKSIDTSNTNLIKPEYKYISKIPKVVIQTSKNQLDDYYVNILKRKLQGWEYKHFTDVQILQFFQDNPLSEFKDIESVFKSFKRGEHKADLFRYYYLYCKGGVYIDTDMMIYKHVEDIIKDYDFVAQKNDILNFYSQAFLGCVKNHPVVYEMLKQAYSVDTKKLNNTKLGYITYNTFLYQMRDIVLKLKPTNIYLYKDIIDVPYFSIKNVDEQNDKKLIIQHFSFPILNGKIPKSYLY